MRDKVTSDFYNKNHFEFGTYTEIPRWISYYHQIKEVMTGGACLVIGVGDGIVPMILKQLGVVVYTFDYSKDLKPDFCGDLTKISDVIPQGFTVDTILCCQVLEHLEYKHFEPILKQFRAIATKKVVISLPCRQACVSMAIKIPDFPQKKLALRIPCAWTKKIQARSKEHHWEISSRPYPKIRISRSIEKYFHIQKSFNVFENQYHRFFTLIGKPCALSSRANQD